MGGREGRRKKERKRKTQKWKEPKCLSSNKWINTIWHIQLDFI
jgi:hypothetical protein